MSSTPVINLLLSLRSLYLGPIYLKTYVMTPAPALIAHNGRTSVHERSPTNNLTTKCQPVREREREREREEDDRHR